MNYYVFFTEPQHPENQGKWATEDACDAEDACKNFMDDNPNLSVVAVMPEWMYRQCAFGSKGDRNFHIRPKEEVKAEGYGSPDSILLEAIKVRGGDRKADYGDAVENFKNIAECASLLVGRELTPSECCTVMMAVKLMRQKFKHKRDNLVDLCGYADILNLIEEAKQ